MSDRHLRSAVLVLAALGAAAAGYLTYTHLAGAPPACATGGCETVQESRYSELAGIPVAALGLAGYLAIAATAASRAEAGRAAGFVFALAGLAFAGYLVYVQVGVLRALCQWCLASDAVLALLVVATALRLQERRPTPAGGATAAPAGRPGGGSAPRAPRWSGRGRRRRAGRGRPRR